MSQIEAGRETDLLVAEKVMRLKNLTVIKPEDRQYKHDDIYYGDSEKDGIENCGRVPDYSTSIAGAWPVLQWLIDLYGPEVVVVVGYDQELDRWMCGPHALLPAVAIAETAPLAICRAALEAYAKHVLDDSRRMDDLRRPNRRGLKLE